MAVMFLGLQEPGSNCGFSCRNSKWKVLNMASKREDQKLDLVKESHLAVKEIAEARRLFASGKIGNEQAAAHIGLFNATARVMNCAINAERWKREESAS
jgi:hypothetical protein